MEMAVGTFRNWSWSSVNPASCSWMAATLWPSNVDHTASTTLLNSQTAKLSCYTRERGWGIPETTPQRPAPDGHGFRFAAIAAQSVSVGGGQPALLRRVSKIRGLGQPR